jgi:peptidoglycan/LPS O-acetylase OafA/YrhL
VSKERQRARQSGQRQSGERQSAGRQAAERTGSRRVTGPAAGSAAKARRATRSGREPVYRLRRFPPLPWRLKLALAVGWLAVAVAVVYLVPTWTGRLGLLVVATAALPLVVVLVRDPSRRTR